MGAVDKRQQQRQAEAGETLAIVMLLVAEWLRQNAPEARIEIKADNGLGQTVTLLAACERAMAEYGAAQGVRV